LPRTAVWFKGLTSPDDPTDLVKQFSRLPQRKRLLALILLTDPEIYRLPADAALLTLDDAGASHRQRTLRVVGTSEELMQRAKDIGQQWVRGVGVARLLVSTLT
jgi:hypothetical protein